jgi:trigger factor
VSTAVDCKHSIEIEIPLEQIRKAQEEVTETIRGRARLPGFRPGKAPLGIIRSRFQQEIRREVLDKLIPQAFRARVEKDGLKVVGTPDIRDLKFEPDQPIRFSAAFEVAPEFEIAPYRGLSVQYEEPTVTDQEVDERLEAMRESKAEYVNVDPRPIEDGDYVMVSLKSVSGLAEPLVQESVQFHIGDKDSLPEFAENLVGAAPGEIREFDVTYPVDYGQDNLAGRTVRFAITPKVIRRKELPALDDEFAHDLGDYQNLEELKTAVRKTIASEKQFAAQQKAKESLLDQLVDTNTFPVPEAYVERQIENQVRNRLRDLQAKGVDPKSLQLDWEKIKESQRDQATRSVKVALLIEKIAEREGIYATKDEVDREVAILARREREAVPVVRARLEKDGILPRIADHIRTEKAVQFLFDQAEKHA